MKACGSARSDIRRAEFLSPILHGEITTMSGSQTFRRVPNWYMKQCRRGMTRTHGQHLSASSGSKCRNRTEAMSWTCSRPCHTIRISQSAATAKTRTTAIGLCCGNCWRSAVLSWPSGSARSSFLRACEEQGIFAWSKFRERNWATLSAAAHPGGSFPNRS